MSTHHSFWADLRAGSFSQGYLTAGGIRTRYLHAGERGTPPLILIHGTGGHAEAYTRNLVAHGEHFDTYAIDLVGHGWSDKPLAPYEISVYVRHLRAVLDTLGFERAHVSGESLGGWVGARFALEYPDRVDRLVLNTTGGATLDLAVMERIKTLSTAAVENPSWETIKARLEWLMADPAVVTDDLVACRQSHLRAAGDARRHAAHPVPAGAGHPPPQQPDRRRVGGHQGAHAGAVDGQGPDRRRERRPAHCRPDPERAAGSDGALWPLAAVRGRAALQ